MDDINVGLENMRFQQRSTTPSAPGRLGERRYSPNDIGVGSVGQDGAMEIRGREGVTASVYSVDDGKSLMSGSSRGPDTRSFEQRRESNHSHHLEMYGDDRRDSGGSFLPYDDHFRDPAQTPQQPTQYGQQQQIPSYQPQKQYNEFTSQAPSFSNANQPYYSEAGPSGSHYAQDQSEQRNHPQSPQYQSNTSYGPPPPNQYYNQQGQQQQHQQQQQQFHPQQNQPSFQPQPPHGGWGYDHSQAAAQNPYYVAATGQLGFPDGYGAPNPFGLHRTTSNASSLRSMGNSLAPSSSMNGGGGASLGRATSSMTLAGVRRKATTNGSSAGTGPPITKSSVDEYRSRIKADPDPEAQFNFAKYLIEAAKKISSSASGDEKSAKKYRDALLAESLKLIKRLATQGAGVGKPAYADAQFFLANCLGNGSLGLQVDHEKAYNLYVQASKQNHSSATYRTAVCNEVGAGTRRDHARAVLFYRKASALGDTAGMYKLGMILLNGLLGQQKNAKDAVAWLKRAASQADEDNPHALHELGLLYEKAPGPGQPGSLSGLAPYDLAQARELFTQAGQFGYPPSQFKLGTCYEYGSLTCPVDPRRSIAWYTRAAERGDAESELALSGWYLTGSEGVLKQSDSEAYLWARRAANKGLPKAEYAVGYYSEVGIGVKTDTEEAKRWYMRAAGTFHFTLSTSLRWN